MEKEKLDIQSYKGQVQVGQTLQGDQQLPGFLQVQFVLGNPVLRDVQGFLPDPVTYKQDGGMTEERL